VTAGYNKLRAWVSMSESMYEKYKAPPAPIDFATTKKSVRDGALVDQLESFYKASKPPAEKYEMPPEETTKSDETIAFLKEADKLNKELLPVIEKEIDFYGSTRTTVETTFYDAMVNYPSIHEEIEDELERREWFKDTPYASGNK
jgi:ATP synthase D chain, mitochondrial (ATP5H)